MPYSNTYTSVSAVLMFVLFMLMMTTSSYFLVELRLNWSATILMIELSFK